MKTGVELIEAERQRQIEKGYSLQHDQNYMNDELMGYAMFLLTLNLRHFPESFDPALIKQAFSRSDFDNQVIAGALIAANLDRINGKSKLLE